MTTRRALASNDKAIDAFIAAKAEIDAMLARIADLSDDHFNTNPIEIHWGHVGDLKRYAGLLRQITDAAFKEGDTPNKRAGNQRAARQSGGLASVEGGASRAAR